jgi:hypothetical protein
MNRITIEIGNRRRLVIYKQGGCNLEENVEGIGWCLNDWDTVDWQPILTEAQSVLARVSENIRLAC